MQHPKSLKTLIETLQLGVHTQTSTDVNIEPDLAQEIIDRHDTYTRIEAAMKKSPEGALMWAAMTANIRDLDKPNSKL